MLYEGNDVAPGKNVTIVSPTSKLPFPDDMFDVIISTECFEHDPEWELSFKKIYKMLKPGGLFCFTCASTGRPEHGTRRTTMQDSFGCKNGIVGWTDYYLNLTIEHVKTLEPLEDVFSKVNCYYNSISHDLYFWGIKKTDTPTSYDVPSFTDKGVTQLV
jgi:SAM-dependent methyltransferase